MTVLHEIAPELLLRNAIWIYASYGSFPTPAEAILIESHYRGIIVSEMESADPASALALRRGLEANETALRLYLEKCNVIC